MQGNPTYRLVVRRGPQPNQVYELSGDVTNLGRDITNDIVINDREVSRHHMRLMRGDDGYTIEDLGSTNGTFVGGKRLTGATPLKNGDMIGLGETVTLGFEVVRPGQQQGESADAPAPDEASQQTMEASGQDDQDRYRRPAQQQPSAQSSSPSSGSEQSQPNPYQQSSSQPQQQAQPAQAQQYQPQDSGGQQQEEQYAVQGAYGPPPPGYDYDPYAMREESGSNRWRWVIFGCLGLIFFCCCISVLALIVIDTFVLYCDIPVLRDVLEALALLQCPA